MDLISGLRNQAAESKSGVHPDVIAAFSLEGRTAVVTGAARGIGQQTAVTYAKAGARVVIADRLKEGLAETEALIGDGVVVVPTDVSDKTAVDDLARQAVHATGRIDVWANVAGVINNFMVVDATPEDVKAILDVNLMGVYWGCAAAGRVMSVVGIPGCVGSSLGIFGSMSTSILVAPTKLRSSPTQFSASAPRTVTF